MLLIPLFCFKGLFTYSINVNNSPVIKKVVSIFLAFVLVFNSYGLPFFYWVKIQVCKAKAEFAEMEREGSQTPVVFSSLTKGLHQVGDDELQVDGKMYDIVKTREHNGIKYYYAIGDGEEDNYVNKLAETEKGDAGVNSIPSKEVKSYELKYIAVAKSFIPVVIPGGQSNKFNCITTPMIYRSHFKDVFSPPPDRFSS